MASTQEQLLEQLVATQKSLEPQLRALRTITSALQQAIKTAKEEHPDALAMYKALGKLQQANTLWEDETLQGVTATFAQTTQSALDALAFEFPRDLKETFTQRGQGVAGRPPTLAVEPFVLEIDIANRRAQWFYGKEALARPIALSISTIVQIYDQQHKAIIGRTLDNTAFVAELYQAWTDLLAKRTQRPVGGRVSLVEIYSQVVLNRQSARFWNAPSRNTFKDYDRAHFVRDLTQAHESATVQANGQSYQLRLGGATKNQADSPNRSIWLPQSTLDGEYYASLTFEQTEQHATRGE